MYELSNSINFRNFKTSLVTAPPTTHERHYDALRTKIDMWLTPKTTSKKPDENAASLLSNLNIAEHL